MCEMCWTLSSTVTSTVHQTEQYREQKPVLLFSKANLALCLSFLLVSLSLPGEFVSTRESINKFQGAPASRWCAGGATMKVHEYADFQRVKGLASLFQV